MKQLVLGFRTLFNGMSLIRKNPRILKLTIIPFIIDFLVLVGTFAWGSSRISGWVDQAMVYMLPNSEGVVYHLIYWPLFFVAWILLIASLFFVGFIVATLVAGPFHSLLAEATLEELGAIQKTKFNFSRWIKMSAKMLWAGLLKTALFLLFGAMFFLMSFFPVIGFLASFGMLMIMAFDSVDYSFEVMGFNLKKRLGFFRKNFFYFAGSGLSLGMTLLIPGVNFLLLPAAVVGSADLLNKRLLEQKALQ